MTLILFELSTIYCSLFYIGYVDNAVVLMLTLSAKNDIGNATIANANVKIIVTIAKAILYLRLSCKYVTTALYVGKLIISSMIIINTYTKQMDGGVCFKYCTFVLRC